MKFINLEFAILPEWLSSQLPESFLSNPDWKHWDYRCVLPQLALHWCWGSSSVFTLSVNYLLRLRSCSLLPNFKDLALL